VKLAKRERERYRKIVHGEQLTKAILENRPERFAELRGLLVAAGLNPPTAAQT